MQMESGKYIGCEVAALPTEYLEWAMGHLSMTDAARGAVMAEYARRANEARVEAETPGQQLRARLGRTVTKLLAGHSRHP